MVSQSRGSKTRIASALFRSLCGLLLISGPAWALAIVSGSNTVAQIFIDQLPHVLAVNAGGVTNLTVTTTGTTQLMILFNAECTVDAFDDTTFVDIDILVDGVAVPPSHGADTAFCTSTGDGELQHWVSASTNVVKTVAAGSHTVQVRGTLRGFSAGDRWQIDDLSLIVLRQP